MYGTIARLTVRTGKFDELLQIMRDYDHLQVPGMISTHVYRSDANAEEVWVAVAFESRESYVANAESPEQHERFEKMRALLAADPEWHDGEILSGVG